MSSVESEPQGERMQNPVERLRALWQEAQAAGQAPVLAEEMRRLLAGAGADSGLGAAASIQGGSGPEIPMRFGMVGESKPMQELFGLLERVAPAKVPVLVQGETGAGKELVARALHDHSPRAKGPFLAENCAAVPANLLESELFGHEKGAFTGAVAKRPGHFQAADGGTVFLDEIGDMPLEMQAKLLRVLQDGEVRPVGSNRSVKVDVRVVAATHRDLPEAVAAGGFREDLYFRLNVITLKVPPLRERSSDIPLLVRFFLDKIGQEMGRESSIDEGALDCLQAWKWPGNVRELENEIRRAIALSSGTIRAEDLSPKVQAGL